MSSEEAMFEIGRYYEEGIRPSEESIKHIIHVLQNTDDDCISRQLILDKIEEVCFSKEWIEYRINNGSNGTRDYLISFIENLSSVQPQEPKTGHWKRISIDKYVQHAMAYYKCSECGEDVIGKHNYCPNCGARMVEPQESEDK